MSVVPMPQIRPNRSQGPWDRRNVAELSQTNFRTELRGFDREEVRAILDSVAADYRVLQLQNASLQRQLADLEAVLQAYHRGDGPSTGPALTGHVLQRANEEARAILMRAHAQAEDTMSRVVARAREAERPIEQFEQDQRHFRALLAGTVSELLGVLSLTHRPPSGSAEPRQIAARLLLEAPASAAPVTSPDVPLAAPSGTTIAADARDEGIDAAPPARDANATVEPAPEAQSLALVPLARVSHDSGPANRSGAAPVGATQDVESIELLLKSIDRALVGIPALPCE